MKKLLLSLLLCGIILTSHSYAQLQRESNLGDIIIKFCDDASIVWWSKSSILNTKPQEPTDICMLLQNDWPTDATISINFVDGTITADQDQKKACEPETSNTNFGQYITGYSTIITIPAGTTLQTGASATFPAWYAGTAYWCVTFQVIDNNTNPTDPNQMFKILSRRASFIDINVMGDYVIDLQAQDATTQGSMTTFNSTKISVVDSLLISWQNFSEAINQKNLLLLKLGKPLTIRSNLMNNGNIWLNVNIESQYRAWFGLIHANLWTQEQKFVPKQAKAIEFSTNDLAWWLGGPATITQTITYTPIIIGSGGNIDPILLQPQTMILVTSGLVIARYGWWLIIIIIMWWWISHKISSYKRRKHKQKKDKTND